MNFQTKHSITSSANPKFKFLLQLEKSKFRKEQQLALVEGEKEIEMALAGQSDFHSVYFLPEKANHSVLYQISNKFKNIEFIESIYYTFLNKLI